MPAPRATLLARSLLATTERTLANGGMIVEETGKPRTAGGIFVKLLRDATAELLPADMQAATLSRIKREVRRRRPLP